MYKLPDHLIRRETARPRKSLDEMEGESDGDCRLDQLDDFFMSRLCP